MKCEDVQEVLEKLELDEDSIRLRQAQEHLRSCDQCRDAVHAAQVLERAAAEPPPGPREGAFERAMLAATRSTHADRPERRSFWRGMALGGALAAGLAAAALVLLPVTDGPSPGGATPVVHIAPNEVREISISLDSPQPLSDAGIRIVLSGNIALEGYENQRELSWSTRLDPGPNQLTLPIVTLGSGGGQLLVEVASGAKHKTFLVDVRTDAPI